MDVEQIPKAVITDLDGTLTDERRRLNTRAVDCIRLLVDAGIPVVLASGNTICSLTILCKMIGTDGTVVCENGGLYRVGFQGEQHILGDIDLCRSAFSHLERYFGDKGIELELYSPEYRFADVAFARTVDPEEVRSALAGFDVRVLDTGFAIHLQGHAISKGTAFRHVAEDLGIGVSDFLAVGDSHNDKEMLRTAGIGIAVANCSDDVRDSADRVTKEEYGDGFIEAVQSVFPSLS